MRFLSFAEKNAIKICSDAIYKTLKIFILVQLKSNKVKK